MVPALKCACAASSFDDPAALSNAEAKEPQSFLSVPAFFAASQRATALSKGSRALAETCASFFGTGASCEPGVFCACDSFCFASLICSSDGGAGAFSSAAVLAPGPPADGPPQPIAAERNS